jgi:hypothetical protein
MFQKMLEKDMKDIVNSMAVPKEYLKYNVRAELEKSTQYIMYNTNVKWDPTYWPMVMEKLKNKIAKLTAITWLEVNDDR